MGVQVAEYLGVRTDTGIPINPIPVSKSRNQKPTLPCPFRNAHCSKAKRGDKPICSLRDTSSNSIWIVCEHRLCATSPKAVPLNSHQADILHQVAKTVFDPGIPRSDVLVKREEPIRVTASSEYSADYILWRLNPNQTSPHNPNRAMILEMQGGGETTNTGDLTRHIDVWEVAGAVNNTLLNQVVRSVSPLETNAWRRQQEQFLVKGNVAMLTGARMVFCIGSLIYDYLIQRFRDGILIDLQDANWTLALITFIEDVNAPIQPGCPPHAIQLKIDPTRTKFTNYNTFVQVLVNQAAPCPLVFEGDYIDLLGNQHTI